MEDFESTPEFQALIVAATGKPERSMGDSVIPAEPPQWNEVRSLAKKLLVTADNQLALHVYLIQAEANIVGFTGFRDALQTTLELIQNRWDDMYPAPDQEDPDDMYYARINLVNELSEQPVFLDSIHRLPLVSVRGIGEFSSRDIDISAGVVSGSEEDRARCQEGLIRGAFAESDKENLQRMADSLEALPELCRAIEGAFNEKTGQSGVLSLKRLITRIDTCRDNYNEFAKEHLEQVASQAETAGESGTAPDVGGAVQTTAPAPCSSLGSRAMVMESFDAILRYYEQHEPSSPVRELTYRTREFVNKPFFELMQALAPAYRDDLPGMLAQLQKQPLAAVLSDSYSRFLTGETLPVSPQPTALPEGIAPNNNGENMHRVGEGPQHTGALTTNNSGNNDSGIVIGSRQQVLEVLQDIETYFVNAEPASPIPLVISDIRKLVSKRFVELVTEFSRLLPAATTEAVE